MELPYDLHFGIVYHEAFDELVAYGKGRAANPAAPDELFVLALDSSGSGLWEYRGSSQQDWDSSAWGMKMLPAAAGKLVWFIWADRSSGFQSSQLTYYAIDASSCP